VYKRQLPSSPGWDICLVISATSAVTSAFTSPWVPASSSASSWPWLCICFGGSYTAINYEW